MPFVGDVSASLYSSARLARDGRYAAIFRFEFWDGEVEESMVEGISSL